MYAKKEATMKTIQLKHGMGRYSDVSPFPMGELELELLDIPQYNGDFRFVALCNGVKCAEYSVSAAQNRVKISRDKLTAGRFSCFVSHYISGTEVKRWRVEDLLITELDGTMTADPEVAQLTRKVAALEKEAEEERAAREAADEKANAAVEYVNQIALGLVKFAFADYSENVYLPNGSFEDFLQTYGIDLSNIPEEKIKEIKGGNQNDEA